MDKNILLAFGIVTLLFVIMMILFVVFAVALNNEENKVSLKSNNLMDWNIFATGS